MSVILPDPDEIHHVSTGTIIRWKCPKCHLSGTIEDGFGLRYMNRPKVVAGIEDPEWRKQSYCYRCRMAYWGVKRVDPAQPYLIDLDDDHHDEVDALPDDLTNYFEGIQ